MKTVFSTRSPLMMCSAAGGAAVLLVNAIVATVDAYGVLGGGFVWYCTALMVSTAAIAASATARERLRVLLVFPAVSAYVYAFGVSLPDPDALWRVTGGTVGFAVMFFGPVIPAIYLALLAVSAQRGHTPLTRRQAVH